MDEFGERKADHAQDRDTPELVSKPTSPTSLQRGHESDIDRSRLRPSPPPSPAPFAHYAMSASSYDNTSPQMAQHPTTPQIDQAQPEHEDDSGGGCCKCVIM